jgi:hypothetical protein
MNKQSGMVSIDIPLYAIDSYLPALKTTTIAMTFPIRQQAIFMNLNLGKKS